MSRKPIELQKGVPRPVDNSDVAAHIEERVRRVLFTDFVDDITLGESRGGYSESAAQRLSSASRIQRAA